jgi:Zn finger protein HypA/HybF involved in hydrogenase expression
MTSLEKKALDLLRNLAIETSNTPCSNCGAEFDAGDHDSECPVCAARAQAMNFLLGDACVEWFNKSGFESTALEIN